MVLNNVIICIMYSYSWAKASYGMVDRAFGAIAASGAIGSHWRHCNGTTCATRWRYQQKVIVTNVVIVTNDDIGDNGDCSPLAPLTESLLAPMCNGCSCFIDTTQEHHWNLILHSSFYLTLLPLILNTLAPTTSSLRTQFIIKITIELSC